MAALGTGKMKRQEKKAPLAADRPMPLSAMLVNLGVHAPVAPAALRNFEVAALGISVLPDGFVTETGFSWQSFSDPTFGSTTQLV